MKTNLSQTLNDAIDSISEGIKNLEDNKDALLSSSLTPKGVDRTARLCAQINVLNSILEPLKNSLRIESIQAGTENIYGYHYQAVVTEVLKTVFDLDKIKALLVKRLPQYQKTQKEIRVSFKIKT